MFAPLPATCSGLFETADGSFAGERRKGHPGWVALNFWREKEVGGMAFENLVFVQCENQWLVLCGGRLVAAAGDFEEAAALALAASLF